MGLPWNRQLDPLCKISSGIKKKHENNLSVRLEPPTYNQIQHLIQDTVWKSDKTQGNITYNTAMRSVLSQQVTTRLRARTHTLCTEFHSACNTYIIVTEIL